MYMSEKQVYIWGTYPQWQLNQMTTKVTPGLYKFDVVCFHMMLLGSDMFSVATAGHGYA